MKKSTIRVATDVGGTFTDLVCFETDALKLANTQLLLQSLIQLHQILKQGF